MTVKAVEAMGGMEGWPVLKDAIECGTFINVPVLKQRSTSADIDKADIVVFNSFPA